LRVKLLALESPSMKQLEKFALLCAFLYSIPLDLPATQSKIPVQASQAYGKVPLSFEPNLGQADQRVEFLAHGDGYGLFLTHKGAVLRLERGPNGAGVMMRLLHANPRSLVEGVDALPGKSNYFVGNDQTKWRTNIPTYSRVRYRDIYPGIDAVFSGRQRELEYDLVVAPGAGVGSIRLGFSGVRSIRIDENGDLVLRTGTGDVTQHRPIIYQDSAGERRLIAGRYVRKGRLEVAFEVAKYDRNLPLVIDPDQRQLDFRADDKLKFPVGGQRKSI